MASYYTEEIQGGRIKLGSTTYEMAEIRYGANLELVWPLSVYAYLTPAWSYPTGASYSLTTMPAKGGDAFATWTLTVVQAGQTVYTATVTPTSYTLGDSTNFTYTTSSGKWHANDRGSNGYSSSTTAPTSDQWSSPARSCTLDVSYTGNVTINGQSVSITALGSASMTQNSNTAHYDSTQDIYDNYSVSLNRYYSSGDSACPAGGTQSERSATISSSCRCQTYIYWDSDAHRYYYQTISGLTVTSDQSWATISGDTITAADRETTTGSERHATVTAQLSGQPTTVTVAFYQKLNRIESTVPAYNTVSTYYLNEISDTIPVLGGSVALTGYWNGTHTTEYNEYSSGAHTGGVTSSVSNQPAAPDHYKLGSSGSWVSGSSATVSTSNAHSTYRVTFYVYGQYMGVSTYTSRTMYQDADTTYTGTVNANFSASITASGTLTPGPNSSTLTLSYSAKHDVYTVTYWGSDDTEKSRTKTQSDVPDTPTITVDTSESTAQGAANRFTRSGTTVTHTTMTKFTGIDKITITATHPDDSTVTQSVSRSTTNSLESTSTVTGPVIPGTTTYSYRNWILTLSSSPDYGSQSSAAPKGAGSTTLSVAASHEVKSTTPWTQTVTTTNHYTSDYDDVIITENSGTDVVDWTKVSDLDICSFSKSYPSGVSDFVTIGNLIPKANTTGEATASATISNNNGGDARSCLIMFNRSSQSPGGAGTAQEWIYQKAGNISLACVDADGNPVTQLTFTKFGGTQTFRVVAVSSGWTRATSYSSTYNPFTGGSVTPASGNAGTTTITVQIAQHTSTFYGSDHRIGTITFTATDDDTVTATVRVDQYPAVGDGN